MSQVKSIKYLYNFIDFFIIYLAVISPYAALNDEALSLFKRASPLPKPPKEMLKNGDKISFVMPIDYNIKDYLGKK
ncbi:energy transducer TonB [Campylobacter jejuni]|nr:energy transducer TonB [Campylobacter jejuni]